MLNRFRKSVSRSVQIAEFRMEACLVLVTFAAQRSANLLAERDGSGKASAPV